MNTVQIILTDVATYGPEVIKWALVIIGVAATSAAQMPSTTSASGKAFVIVRAVIDAIGQNFKNASNAK
jgi:hypothetical protein